MDIVLSILSLMDEITTRKKCLHMKFGMLFCFVSVRVEKVVLHKHAEMKISRENVPFCTFQGINS